MQKWSRDVVMLGSIYVIILRNRAMKSVVYNIWFPIPMKWKIIVVVQKVMVIIF